MSDTPLVHVLVINWNGIEHLQDCFDSLVACDYANARFILLDNASDDDSVQFVTDTYTDPRIEIMQLDANYGWSGANNRGMEAALEAGSDYVLLLNNDTKVEPDFLSKLVDTAESDPTIGALSPRILMFYNTHIINSLGLKMSLIGAGWDIGIGQPDNSKWNVPTETLGVCGAAMFLRCDVLERTGLLPDDFGIYLDDLDLCLRIWESGYTIRLCYDSVVYHKFSATMGEGKRARHKYYLNTRNRTRVVMRHFPVSKWPLAKLSFSIGEVKAIGRAILDADLWKLPLHARTWIDAICYFPRALRFRRETNQVMTPKMWSLVEKDRLFFPGMPVESDMNDAH